ncbi:MAG: hypothetical protein A4E54_00467 [Pelotomaculum sp. PtaB.Bin117]|nr:MAG: hypothetical protein A4E54_00467 [Pelotomaculum sp. PtaB.Bin117]
MGALGNCQEAVFACGPGGGRLGSHTRHGTRADPADPPGSHVQGCYSACTDRI